MPFKPNSRSFFTIIYTLVFLIFLVVILWISDLALSIWQRLEQQSDWFFWGYISVLFVFIILALLLFWRLLPKSPNRIEAENNAQNTESVNPEVLQQRLEKVDESLVDTSSIRDELDQLMEGQVSGQDLKDEIFAQSTDSDGSKAQISIVLFGDISSGKSSLINTLLPQAEVETSVVGGTTREVNRYLWKTPLGDSLLMVDIPGFDEQHQHLDEMARKAVYQGHMALFICDGDLTASQFQRVEEIAQLGKPLLVVLNKKDRFSQQELTIISQEIEAKLSRLSHQLKDNSSLPLVSVQTGGQKEVTLVYPDGEEKTELRPIKPDLSPLYTALQQIIENTDQEKLEQVRRQSVLKLLASEIDQVESEAREKQAREVVKKSTQKAVIGSLATITPGTDLLVQGYLGMSMVKELCRVYEVPAKDIDIEKLLKMIQSNTKGAFPLLLAIAGNGFKAFPGIGTVTGGLIHAVAYGLIFDSMGKAVSMTLAVQGDLSPLLVDSIYKERLVEDVESRAVEFVKMVLQSKRDS